jgi:hypothetical protein
MSNRPNNNSCDGEQFHSTGAMRVAIYAAESHRKGCAEIVLGT